MPVTLDNARGVIGRLNGQVVAYAGGGGCRLEPAFGNRELKLTWISLRDVTLTKVGCELLSGSNEAEKLQSELFRIEIRNNDGSVTPFERCKADMGGRAEDREHPDDFPKKQRPRH